MSSMKMMRSQRGEINVLIVPLVLLTLFFVVSLAFGLWAYSGRNDYKTNSDKKVAAAVQVAKNEEDIVKDKQHAEADKSPLKTYVGPEQYGGIHVLFPKTWSGYVLDTGTSSQPLDGYFQPGVVPNISALTSNFALRIQVASKSYSSVLTSYNQQVTAKTLTATPYALPKVPSVVGIRFDGTIDAGKKTVGTIVILPLRDKTLEIWTESPVYAADFANYILPNVTFSP